MQDSFETTEKDLYANGIYYKNYLLLYLLLFFTKRVLKKYMYNYYMILSNK